MRPTNQRPAGGPKHLRRRPRGLRLRGRRRFILSSLTNLRTQYTENHDGLMIAYQVVGDGPVDIVLVQNSSCLDLIWRDPAAGRFRERLARVGRIICFDWSGLGASDQIPLGALPTPERWSEDIRAVLDAVDSPRAFVVAMHGVGPLGILFVALHPERASGLILVDTYARWRRADDYEIGLPDDVADGSIAYLADHWGSERTWKSENPSRSNDLEFVSLQAINQRLTMPPSLAREALDWISRLDVRGILGAVHTPTLVLHSEKRPRVPVGLGQYLAEHVDGAEIRTRLGTENFLFSVEEGKEVADRVAEFITGAPPAIEPDRVLTTVLFTDIVGSTELAARLGSCSEIIWEVPELRAMPAGRRPAITTSLCPTAIPINRPTLAGGWSPGMHPPNRPSGGERCNGTSGSRTGVGSPTPSRYGEHRDSGHQEGGGTGVLSTVVRSEGRGPLARSTRSC